MIQKMDKDLYKYVGQQIREAREKKGISLRELSNMIGGKRSNQTLMRYEKGESRIDMESLVPICKALGLDVDAVTDEAKRRMYADTEELSDIQKAYAKADPQIQKAIRLMLHIDKQQKKGSALARSAPPLAIKEKPMPYPHLNATGKALLNAIPATIQVKKYVVYSGPWPPII